MHAIDLNTLAQKICEVEGKKEEVNIAQVKEVLSITLDLLREEFSNGNAAGVVYLMERKNKP